MSAVPKPKLTPAEYLAIERAADVKSEFYNGEMFAMSGASYAHTLIKDNIAGELRAALKGGPCRTLSSDMRVLVSATGLYTYPDVVVVCGTPQFTDAQLDTLLNPRVIIEVLSDSTARYDRTTKFRHYQQVPSLLEYVLVAQDEPLVERFVRQTDDTWSFKVFADPAGAFALATVDASIQLAEVYRGVELPDRPLR